MASRRVVGTQLLALVTGALAASFVFRVLDSRVAPTESEAWLGALRLMLVSAAPYLLMIIAVGRPRGVLPPVLRGYALGISIYVIIAVPVAVLSLMSMWAPRADFSGTLILVVAKATLPLLALGESFGVLAPLVGGTFLIANAALAFALPRAPGEGATQSHGGSGFAIAIGVLGGFVLPAATFISLAHS